MVDIQGFTAQEERIIKGMMDRLHADNHRLSKLRQVMKVEMPGYNGKVVPKRVGESGIEMDMMLSCCNPFTVAHELAHVSDIASRPQEAIDNIDMRMSTDWHLAHRMSAEYFANRVACDYSEEHHIFEAFQNDHNGLKLAVMENDWASFLIHYALMLGIFHGMGRMDVCPSGLLKGDHGLPEAVRRGLENFRAQATAFFDNHCALAVSSA